MPKATLADIVHWKGPHTRGRDEDVRYFLKRRLNSIAEAITEEFFVDAHRIVEICSLTGDEPFSLICDQIDMARGLDEPFKNAVLHSTADWYEKTEMGEILALTRTYQERLRDEAALRQAALDGRVTISGDSLFVKEGEWREI